MRRPGCQSIPRFTTINFGREQRPAARAYAAGHAIASIVLLGGLVIVFPTVLPRPTRIAVLTMMDALLTVTHLISLGNAHPLFCLADSAC